MCVRAVLIWACWSGHRQTQDAAMMFTDQPRPARQPASELQQAHRLKPVLPVRCAAVTNRRRCAAGAGGGERQQRGAGQDVTGLGLPQRLLAVLDLVTRSPAGQQCPPVQGLCRHCVAATCLDRSIQCSDIGFSRQRRAGSMNPAYSKSALAARATRTEPLPARVRAR